MDWENQQSVLKALVLLHSFQTYQERYSQRTFEDNGVGFSATDAPFLTSVVEQILDHQRGVSDKQFQLVQTKLRKYQRQIDNLDVDAVILPLTAIVYKNSDRKDVDGIISIDNDNLFFKPFIFPTVQIKTIGFQWSQDGSKRWVAPLSLSAFEQLTEMFPRYSTEPSVRSWLTELDKPVQLSDNIVHSDLLAFQREAVGFMLKANRALLGLAPGLGKTPISILAIKELGGKTLIVCPRSLLYNWRREIKRWAAEDSEIWHSFIGKGDKNWVITNYETVLGYMVQYDEKIQEKNGKKKRIKVNWRPSRSLPFDNLIIDESVLIKSKDAQRSHAIYTIANKVPQIKRVYLLSGSPITKFLDDMWHQFHVIDKSRFPSYWAFARDFCIIEDTFWGTKIASDQEGAAQRIKRQYRDIYFARTQDQVLNLPDWIFDTLEVPMENAQAVLYRQMQKDFIATLPDGDKVIAPNILAQIIRLIQFASNPILLGGPDIYPKWSTVVDLLEFEKLPAIIWTNFIETAQRLHKMLTFKKYNTRMLIGKTSDVDRDTIVQEFQRGKLDAIIAHPGVGKFGLTLTAAHTAIYLERSYNGDDYYQSLHRVRRFGTTHSPHVIILLSVDSQKINGDTVEHPTIDHVIHQVLGFKRENSIQITTGLVREVLGV